MELKEQMRILETNFSNFGQDWRSADFALSLIRQYRKYGKLSDKQVPYVAKLVAKVTGQEEPKQTEELGDFGGVIKLFGAAKAKLKFPKITLQVEGEAVILKLAGAQSKNAGSVYVVSEGGYGQATFYGAISQDGVFTQSNRAQEKLATAFGAALVALLRTLAVDPIKVVQEQAKLTGNCIFCSKALTDERSLAAGFGPICAQKWDLHEAWKRASSVAPQTLTAAVAA